MLLGPADRLPGRPRRVLVAGTSGAGKTTLARRLAALLALPAYELDGLFHGPEWVPRPSFAAEVRTLAATGAWVMEWQYDDVRPLLAERADLLVWLDLPRRLVMARLVARTVRRRLRREQLWNGNREASLRTLLTDPEHVVRHGWSSHAGTGPRVLALHAHRSDLPVARLRTRREVDRWLSGPVRDTVGRTG